MQFKSPIEKEKVNRKKETTRA
uniref:Uncharacterized protein n=1 Tax=Rhizophora mucronata TaxID=61149 RepID=A0A2P2PXU1_RHIMU